LKESIKGLHICLLTPARIFEIGYGGIEKFTTSLGSFLLRHGKHVTLLGSRFASVESKRLSIHDLEDNAQRIPPRKIRVLHPPYIIYAFSRLVMSLLWIVKLFQINKEYPVSLIHAQDTGYCGLAAIISGRILRVPVILSSHGIRHQVIESYVKGKFNNVLLRNEYSLDKFTINHADKVIVPTLAIKKYFEERTHGKIEVIPTTIPAKRFEYSQTNRDQIRKELQLDKNDNVLGFIGRFVPIKNLLTLLTAFANVAKDDPTIKLVLVGTGSLEIQLKEFTREHNILDEVVFCGVRYDTNRILSSFDIFVIPSYSEGLSTALLEAMACGRAIICSDIPANREVVKHKEEAIFFDPYNREELENSIRLLSHDQSLRSKLGSNAKKKATEYDEDIVFPKILQHYEILQQHNNKLDKRLSD